MPPQPLPPTSVEAKLLRQLAELEAQIADLESERRALHRLIAKVRLEDGANKEVARRNSISRILVESRILEAIKSASSPVQSSNLYDAAKSIVPSLKENTFRSHLHRMKLKGLIEPLKKGGVWRLSKK